MTLSSSPIKSPPLYRKAHEVLRKAIIQGQLRPGDRVTETQLAEELRISRTPLREALRQLQTEGLVRRAAGGLVVSEVDLSEIHQMYECRIALERMTARRAAQYATADFADGLARLVQAAREAAAVGDRVSVTAHNVEFHRQIAMASGNPWSVRLLEQIWDRVTLFRISVLQGSDDYERVFGEHEAVLTQLRLRDPEGAEAAMERHLRSDLQRGGMQVQKPRGEAAES